MTVAIWIIAIIEVVRAIQNWIQIIDIKKNSDARDNAYSEFVKSLKMCDREFVQRMQEEFEKGEQE